MRNYRINYEDSLGITRHKTIRAGSPEAALISFKSRFVYSKIISVQEK